MILKYIPFLAIFATALHAHAKPDQVTLYPASMPASELVEKVIATQYAGKLDATHHCYRTAHTGRKDSGFCMQPQAGQAKVVGDRMYFFATSIEEQGADGLEEGLAGLFVMQKNSQGWGLMAANKSVTCGVRGYCALENVAFQQLGRNYYGWMVSSGALAAGGGSLSVEILAPKDARILTLGLFDISSENTAPYSYAFKPLAEGQDDVFGLVRYKRDASGKPAGKTVLPFNKAKWKYDSKFNFVLNK